MSSRRSPRRPPVRTLRAQPREQIGHRAQPADARLSSDPCGDMRMTSTSTNLHFHGLTIPPVCHQDDVLKTSIQPGDAPFEYRFHIPADQPPGLYWYHPHLHGFSRAQVVGGASGALIVEGIENANREAAGLPERVLVIRDQDLLNPNAAPSSGAKGSCSAARSRWRCAKHRQRFRQAGERSVGKFRGFAVSRLPRRDHSDEAGSARIVARRERFVHTYLNLQLLFAGKPQTFGIVGVDGIPINQNGLGGNDLVVWQNHLGVPPGGRMEFVVTGPPTACKHRSSPAP